MCNITRNALCGFLDNCGELWPRLIDRHAGSIAANGALASDDLFIRGFWVASSLVVSRRGSS